MRFRTSLLSQQMFWVLGKFPSTPMIPFILPRIYLACWRREAASQLYTTKDLSLFLVVSTITKRSWRRVRNTMFPQINGQRSPVWSSQERTLLLVPWHLILFTSLEEPAIELPVILSNSIQLRLILGQDWRSNSQIRSHSWYLSRSTILRFSYWEDPSERATTLTRRTKSFCSTLWNRSSSDSKI